MPLLGAGLPTPKLHSRHGGRHWTMREFDPDGQKSDRSAIASR